MLDDMRPEAPGWRGLLRVLGAAVLAAAMFAVPVVAPVGAPQANADATTLQAPPYCPSVIAHYPRVTSSGLSVNCAWVSQLASADPTYEQAVRWDVSGGGPVFAVGDGASRTVTISAVQVAPPRDGNYNPIAGPRSIDWPMCWGECLNDLNVGSITYTKYPLQDGSYSTDPYTFQARTFLGWHLENRNATTECLGAETCTYTLVFNRARALDGTLHAAMTQDSQVMLYTSGLYVPLAFQVGPQPLPVADFTWEQTGPSTVHFDGSSSQGYAITTWAWDFGDRTTASSATSMIDHHFPGPGVYQVHLVVTNANGTSLDTVHAVTVADDLVVNSTGDDPLKAGAQICTTGAVVSGGGAECTLRAAIQGLDAGLGSKITFKIPGTATITPGSDLPKVTAPHASIDGTSQPSGPVTIGGRGLVIDHAADVHVKGLWILGGSDYGITFADSPNGSVTGNTIGLAPGGTADPPAGGILIAGSSGTVVGGPDAADRNVVGAGTGIRVGPSTTGAADGVAIIGNLIGVSTSGAAIGAGEVGVLGLSSGGPSAKGLVIENNTIAGFRHNIVLAGEGLDGANIVHNRVGVDPTASHTVATPLQNIRMDGVPNATIGTIDVSGADHDVLVSGSIQLTVDSASGGSISISFNYPALGATPGPRLGTGTNISGNRVGLLAPGAGAGTTDGIRVWDSADDVTIGANAVAGHHGGEIMISGGRNHFLNQNTIGLDGPSESADAGLVVDQTNGTRIEQNTIGRVTTAVTLTRSTKATLKDNTTGLQADGASAAPDATGIRIGVGSTDAVVGPNNVVANATAVGLSIGADGTTVAGNQFGVPRFGTGVAGDGTGILVGAGTQNTVIGQTQAGNILAGNQLGIDLEGAGATVAFNTLGKVTSGPRGNGTGILAANDASIHDNTIVNSDTAGVRVTNGATVTMRTNSIYATTTQTGIDGAPPAPGLAGAARVQSGSSVRTWLVITGLPTSGAGTIEVFGNPSCADPEGQVPLFTKRPWAGLSTRVINVSGRADLKGLTVTYTAANGKTSVFSNCADAKAWPDTDGDGVPDLVEQQVPSTTTTEQDPMFAAFVSDSDQWVVVQTTVGRLSAVAAIDDPEPTGHAGATFPLGNFTFRVDGVPTGEVAQVQLIVPGGASLAGWWKYGPTQLGDLPHYYGFGYDTATGTGAKITSYLVPNFGPSSVVTLAIQDGGRGDEDLSANGSVTDPGAPSVEAAPVDAVATASTTSGTVPAPPATTVPGLASGTLPQTGGDAYDEGRVAVLLLSVGLALLGLARVRHRRGGSWRVSRPV